MTTKLVVTITGDSIAASAGRWPYQYLGVTSRGDSSSITSMAPAVYRTGNIICVNMAVSGTTLAGGGDSVNNIAPTYVDPVVARKSLPGLTLRKYLFLSAIGSNDSAMGGLASPTLYAAAVAAMAQARRTAGYDLISLCTLLPRGDGSMTEPHRLEYNGKLTDSAWRLSNGVDYVFDLAGEPTVGNPANLPVNNGGDTTWYDSFSIHPQDVSSALLATNQVTPVMNTILAAI
jgi:hypothetical protein